MAPNLRTGHSEFSKQCFHTIPVNLNLFYCGSRNLDQNFGFYFANLCRFKFILNFQNILLYYISSYFIVAAEIGIKIFFCICQSYVGSNLRTGHIKFSK